MPERVKTAGMHALACAIILAFFHETVFRGHSLVPTDIVHELTLPFWDGKRVPSVRNHYLLDVADLEIGWGRFWRQTVRRGQLPLWNPGICGGQPIHAESMPATFRPSRLLYLFLPPERACSLGFVLEVLLGGILMGAFLRELRLSRWASLFGAVAWALNSQSAIWYWRAPTTFAWAPLVLLLFERAVARGSRPHALGAGLALGVAFLSGSVQASFHLGFLCGAWFLGSALWRGAGGMGRLLGHAVIVSGIAVLVSAVQWLPTLELMGLDAWGSAGARGPRPDRMDRLLQIPALLSFALPALAGSTESYDLLKAAGASGMDFNAYIGLTGFAMACIGAVCRRSLRPVGLSVGIAAAVLLLTIATPLVKYLYHRFLIVYAFAALVCAAFGLDAVRAGQSRAAAVARGVFRWLAAGCLALMVGLAAAQAMVCMERPRLEQAGERLVARSRHVATFPYQRAWFRARVGRLLDHYRPANPVFAIPVACALAAAGVLAAARRRRLPAAVVAPALVLLNAADLLSVGREWVPQVSLQQYPLAPSHPALSIMEAERGSGRVARLGLKSLWIFPPNSLTLYALDDLQGTFSLAPDNISRICQGGRIPPQHLLDLANVRFLLTADDVAPPGGACEPCWAGDGIRLYRNAACLPRLQFVARARVVPDRAEAWRIMVSGGFDPRTTVLLEKAPPLAPSLAREGEPEAPAPARQADLRLVEDTPLRVSVEADLPARGFILLADTFYPGWKAFLDGKPAEVLRADGCLRAVEAGPGRHHLVYRFDPASFRWGLGLTSVGLGLVMAGWALRRPARRAKTGGNAHGLVRGA